LWDVLLSPGSEFGSGFPVGFDEFGKLGFGMGVVFGVEDPADVIGDFLLQVLGGNVGLGVLLEVELAALPGAGVEGGAQRGTESDVGVGGDAVGNAEAAFLETGEEVTPVDFGFGEGAGDAKNEAFAVVAADADGDEGGAVPDVAVDADLVVGGVGEEMGDLGKRAGAPFSNSPSSSAVSLETWVEETSKPQSSPMTVVTRRVLTPWRYMLEMAA